MSRQGDLLFEDSISHGAGRRGRQDRKSPRGMGRRRGRGKYSQWEKSQCFMRFQIVAQGNKVEIAAPPAPKKGDFQLIQGRFNERRKWDCFNGRFQSYLYWFNSIHALKTSITLIKSKQFIWTARNFHKPSPATVTPSWLLRVNPAPGLWGLHGGWAQQLSLACVWEAMNKQSEPQKLRELETTHAQNPKHSLTLHSRLPQLHMLPNKCYCNLETLPNRPHAFLMFIFYVKG